MTTVWQRTRWWQVRDPNGSLWCETSDKSEALARLRPGDTLWCLWKLEQLEWRQEVR